MASECRKRWGASSSSSFDRRRWAAGVDLSKRGGHISSSRRRCVERNSLVARLCGKIRDCVWTFGGWWAEFRESSSLAVCVLLLCPGVAIGRRERAAMLVSLLASCRYTETSLTSEWWWWRWWWSSSSSSGAPPDSEWETLSQCVCVYVYMWTTTTSVCVCVEK